MTGPLTLADLPLADITNHIASQPVDKNRIKGLSSYITGQVDSAGTSPVGSGFTVNRSGTGVYDITFTTAYAALPTVVATPGPAGVIRLAVLTAATTTTAQISTFNTGGTATNAAFNFVAFPTV